MKQYSSKIINISIHLSLQLSLYLFLLSNCSEPNVNSHNNQGSNIKNSQSLISNNASANTNSSTSTSDDPFIYPQPDRDVGGYQTDQNAGNTNSQDDLNPGQTAKSTGHISSSNTATGSATNTSASVDRHDGTLKFIARSKPFTLTLSTLVNGVTVASKEFQIAENQRDQLTLPGICLTGAKTCLLVTITGKITQTAGKNECNTTQLVDTNTVYINAKTEGKGISSKCLQSPLDIKDAFNINCPQATGLILGPCQ